MQACGGTQPTTAADLNPTLPYSGMGSNALCLCSSVSWQSRMLKRWSQRSWTASPGTAEGPSTTFQFEASGKKIYAPACSVGEVHSVHEGMLSLRTAGGATDTVQAGSALKGGCQDSWATGRAVAVDSMCCALRALFNSCLLYTSDAADE